MLASSDADVKRLLQAIKCCENGSIDSMSRRKLLNKAFSKVQQGLNHATAADHMVNPIALPAAEQYTAAVEPLGDGGGVFGQGLGKQHTAAACTCMSRSVHVSSSVHMNSISSRLDHCDLVAIAASTLPELYPQTGLQDCLLLNSEATCQDTEPEMYKNAWFVTRRTLQAWVSAAAAFCNLVSCCTASHDAAAIACSRQRAVEDSHWQYFCCSRAAE